MKTRIAQVLIALVIVAAIPLFSQTPENTYANLERHGFEIAEASIYASYFSSASGIGGGVGAANLSLATLGSGSGFDTSADGTVGASIGVGWRRPKRNSNLTISYTVSYTGRVEYSDWRNLSQSLAFNTGRRIGQKLNLGFSAAGSEANLDQFLFEPSLFSEISAVPTSFEDFSTAMLTGQTNNAEIAALLTGSPLQGSPAQTLIYGNRSLFVSASGSLSYAMSGRTSLSFSFGGSRFENLPSSAANTLSASQPILRSGTGLSASAQLSHSITPRTHFAVSGSATRTVSSLEDAYSANLNVSIGRTMSRKWFVSGQAGAGIIRPLRSTYSITQRPEPTVTGSLGYKTFGHTFLTSFSRAVTDSYGLGSTTSMTGTASWQWSRPDKVWNLNAAFNWQQYSGGALSGLSGWRAQGGINRLISRRMALQVEYVYQKYSGEFNGITYDQPIQAVQLALSWRGTQAERGGAPQAASQ